MLCDVCHGLSLWQVLTYKAVRVFVGAAFPGMVGMSEIEFHARYSFDIGVGVELCAIVGGDGFEG